MTHKAIISQGQPPIKIEAGRFYRTKGYQHSVFYAFRSYGVPTHIKLVNVESGGEANSAVFPPEKLELIEGSVTLEPNYD